jgi:hypothetical protein
VLGAGVFDGDTNPPMRKERMREVIKGRNLAGVLADIERTTGRAKGLTYAQAFERIYGEKL